MSEPLEPVAGSRREARAGRNVAGHHIETMASHQPDLFDAPAIPGLRTLPDIVSVAEARVLAERIDGAGLAPFAFQGWLGKRLTASFGWSYDFQRGVLNPAPPMPEWLLPLRERAAVFGGIAPDLLVQALVIRYDPGAVIGWHRDRPQFDRVIGISLGAAAGMRFRRRIAGGFERKTMPLEPNAAYLLADEVRWEWEHSIAALEETRWSITFRSLR